MKTVIFLFLVSVFLSSCHQEEKSPSNLSSQVAPVGGECIAGCVNYESIIDKAIVKLVGQRNQRGCIVVTGKESKVSGSSYCLRTGPFRVTNVAGKQYVYSSILGNIINDKGEEDAAHADIGTVRLLKFQYLNGKLKLIAASDYLDEGNGFGKAPSVSLVVLKNNGEMGWVIDSGYMNQGYIFGGTSIYVVDAKTRFQKVLDVPVLASDCGRDEKCTSIESQLHTDRSEGLTNYLAIKAIVSVERNNKNTERFEFKFEYDIKNGIYSPPKEYLEIFLKI
jgi:hypothetical protein